jgi:ribA/ribD-fused uncharacterized protein
MAARETFTFFWHKKSPFSQWYPSPFTVGGNTYNCAEQYMMHQKALLFGDAEVAAQIMATPDPETQQALGRKVAHFVPKVWERECRKIVHDGNIAKFSQNEHLKQQLFATAGTTLVEASPSDKIWGVGLEESDPRIHDRSQWPGENRLGQVITQVRDELMAQEGN